METSELLVSNHSCQMLYSNIPYYPVYRRTAFKEACTYIRTLAHVLLNCQNCESGARSFRKLDAPVKEILLAHVLVSDLFFLQFFFKIALDSLGCIKKRQHSIY